MTSCFGDSSYFLAMLIPGDINHIKAGIWANQNRRPIVTTEYVLIEVGNFLSPSRTRHLLRGFLRSLRADRRVTVLAATSDLLDRGARLYQERLDKAWSLTDCISFVVMQDHGLMDALTADHHFRQAGFNVLLA